MRFLGHTPALSPALSPAPQFGYTNTWRCACGTYLGKTRVTARDVMRHHRADLLADALERGL